MGRLRKLAEQTPEEAVMAERQSRRYVWSAPVRACVRHPRYGSVTVPHRSNFAAVCCAAELWGCAWTEIRDARVTWAEQAEK